MSGTQRESMIGLMSNSGDPEAKPEFAGVPTGVSGQEDDYEGSGSTSRPAAILDIDGTLVDSNYQHAVAWYRAFRDHDVTLPLYQIHRHIGMGGDQLVGALTGKEFEDRFGDAVREAEGRHFAGMIDEIACFEDSQPLLTALHDSGHRLVLATSARPSEADHYLDLLNARGLADAWTTAEDVRSTKPKPDLVLAAMEKVGAGRAVMVGDSTWDAKAASAAGVEAIGILTGGFSEKELREGGCSVVFQSVTDLLRHLDQTPLSLR